MKVTKRNGSSEDVKLDKIVQSISTVATGELAGLDVFKIAQTTISGLYNNVSTRELDLLSIKTAASNVIEEPLYSKLAAKLLTNYIRKEVEQADIMSFSQSVKENFDNGLISDTTNKFVQANARKLNAAIKDENNALFEYYGLQTVYDRYLLKHPITRFVTETPQYWLLRVACGLSESVKEAIDFYNLLSSQEYMTSTPTLFNSGTRHSQMSSCYLIASPEDSLEKIYKTYSDCAMLSKWAGGLGLSYSSVRSSGALIKGTNGKSNGIIPFVHTLDSSIAAVNQGGRRRGSLALYLDTWHPDVMEFLELRDNTGDKERRAHNLNLANWVPDLFMHRVKNDEDWSLIDPSVAPDLVDLFGSAFEKRYLELEAAGKVTTKISARKVYARMMRTLAETGNGWMCFKDMSNKACNSAVNGLVVHSSNLCLSPDTVIRAVVDGLEMDIELHLLSDKFKNGADILVYTINETTLDYEWQSVLNAGIIAHDAEVLEIHVNGKVIECTEDHLFLTKHRGWVRAIDLQETDELFEPDMRAVHKLELFEITKYMHGKEN